MSGGWRDDRGRLLLAMARRAISEVLAGPDDRAPYPNEPWLDEPGACFVTLKLDGELRGCIGSLAADRSLGEDVRMNARSAAFRDPRFPPLDADELERVRLEVSLLTPLERLDVRDEHDLVRRLEPGRDGLVLESGSQRGTFLPQVWEQLSEPADFVRALKRKAGLAPGDWPADLAVFRYRVEKFAEPDATRA